MRCRRYKRSNILTGNNLGMLGNVHEEPVVDATFEDDRLKNIIQYYSIKPRRNGSGTAHLCEGIAGRW